MTEELLDLSGEAMGLDMAPPPMRLETTAEWDETEQEPDLDILIQSRRQLDASGLPCSGWKYGHALEGLRNAAMSPTQRGYAAAMLRHIAWLIQDQPARHMTKVERATALAKRYQAELRAGRTALVNLAMYLVKEQGLHDAASILGMKEYRVKQLIKAHHGSTIPEHHPTVVPPLKPSLLKAVAADVIREKVAVG